MKDCKNMFEILRKRAGATPHNKAYILLDNEGKEMSITYSELNKRVEAFASYLLTHDVKYNSRCILMFYDQINFITAFIACNSIGAIPVPMNIPSASKPLKKWEDIHKDVSLTCILTEEYQLSALMKILDRSETLRKLPVYTEKPGSHIAFVRELNDIAFIQFTSGTTGAPKGVKVTHESLINNLEQIREKLNMDKKDVILSWLPFYHDMGLIFGMLEGLFAGVQAVFIKPYDFMQNPLIWAQAIKTYQASFICGPNFAYELLTERLNRLTEEECQEISFMSIKRVISGAEPTKINTIIRFLNKATEFGLKERAFMPAYGLAEGTLLVTSCDNGKEPMWVKINRKKLFHQKIEVLSRGRLSDIRDFINEYNEDEEFLLSNGTITKEHTLLIIDTKTKKVLKDLEIGEICVVGPSVTKGYWYHDRDIDDSYIYDAELNQRYLRTGDLGFRDITGELYVLSRMKDIINIGELVYFPQDIEKTASSSAPELEEDGAAAFVVKDQNREKLIILQEIARNARRTPECEKWADEIRKNVFHVFGLKVNTIVFITQRYVPRTTSGKIQRYIAKQKFISNDIKKVIGSSDI